MSQSQEKHEGLIPVRTMMVLLPLAAPSASTDTPRTVSPREGSVGRSR